METTKLSTKGQVILPKAVREARRWKPGTEFIVEEVAGGVLLRPIAPFRRTRFEDVSGSLAYRGTPKTVADMDQAIARGVRARHARGRY